MAHSDPFTFQDGFGDKLTVRPHDSADGTLGVATPKGADPVYLDPRGQRELLEYLQENLDRQRTRVQAALLEELTVSVMTRGRMRREVKNLQQKVDAQYEQITRITEECRRAGISEDQISVTYNQALKRLEPST